MSRPLLASMLALSALATFEAAGIHWKVRKITSADMVEAGRPIFIAAKVDLSDQQASSALLEAALRTPEKVVDGMRFLEAVAVAGLVAASEDGEVWEALRLVLDPRQEEPGAGRLYVGSLPPGVVEQLAARVLHLTTDGGAASDRLGAFLARDASCS